MEDAYAFDNDSPHAVDQLSILARLLDPITTARLAALGIDAGWRCLEIGAGGGSVAAWLADRARVLATDINPRHLRERETLRVLHHDIRTDALPEGGFDLVHARLVLLHLPQREQILRRLLEALKPGGILLLEEFDCAYAPVLSGDPAPFTAFNLALMRHLTALGADVSWGRHAYAALGEAGYVEREVSITVDVWRGGSPGCALHHSNTLHLRDGLLAHGAAEEDLVALRAQLGDPEMAVCGYPVYAVQGRKPA